MPELALDHPERVFNLGPDARLGLLQLIQDRTHRRALVQHLALARPHGHMPVDPNVLRLLSFSHTLVTRVGEDIGFLSVQQRMRLRHVVDVGRRAEGVQNFV